VAVLEIRFRAGAAHHSGGPWRDARAHRDDPLVAVLENSFSAGPYGTVRTSRGSSHTSTSRKPRSGRASNTADGRTTRRCNDRSASAAHARGASSAGGTA
jgi:hypothetical protein